ncbi:MAG: ABC transporter substrate-binding protein [Sphaerochaetaceae bacterium]|nr:ABC transporter substrate-binding protein [Sphaerochaetaceae bacterium]
MKKFVCFVLIGCLIVTTLFAGGSAETGNVTKRTIRIAIPGVSETDTIDPISGVVTPGLSKSKKFFEEQFHKTLPDVNVELIGVAWDGWIQKMEVLNNSGDIDIGFFTNQIAVPDWYMDLTPYMAQDKDINFNNFDDLFIPSAVHYSYYKSFNYPEYTNNVYGLPIGIINEIFVFDKEIFDHYGVPYPTEKTTFRELTDMAEKMAGIDPVTGKQTYGAFVSDHWMEWFSVSFDAVKPLFSEDMILANIDENEYVEYIKDSPEVLEFFKTMLRLVDCSPAGVATGSGAERFFAEDNNIAINFDVNTINSLWLSYMFANATHITDRFQPVFIPENSKGYQGFPEFTRFAVSKKAKDPELAWEVLKIMVTSKDIINYYITYIQPDKLPVIKDISGLKILEDYEMNQKRYEYQAATTFMTDDYWNWRGVLRSSVCNRLLTKSYTAEEARQAFYDGVKKWVSDTKRQLGQ